MIVEDPQGRTGQDQDEDGERLEERVSVGDGGERTVGSTFHYGARVGRGRGDEGACLEEGQGDGRWVGMMETVTAE